jgi:hypothetical protein
MKTTFGRRVAVLGFLILFFLLIFGIARSYSYAIVAYVVEQALLQKAPEGTSTAQVQERFETALASTPEESKLLKLMALSSYLEKVQKLTPTELDRLLAPGGAGNGAGY